MVARIQTRTVAFGGAGTLLKQFNIEGLASVNSSKRQSQGVTPVPFASSDKALLVSFMGQTRTFNVSFILLQRDDDYTAGTGTAPTGTPNEQANYLDTEIFTPRNQHAFIDELDNVYLGRIEDFSIDKSGDDPLKYDVSFTFIQGITVGL